MNPLARASAATGGSDQLVTSAATGGTGLTVLRSVTGGARAARRGGVREKDAPATRATLATIALRARSVITMGSRARRVANQFASPMSRATGMGIVCPDRACVILAGAELDARIANPGTLERSAN